MIPERRFRLTVSANAGPPGAAWRCLLLGLAFGAAGAVWIGFSHRNPARAWHYHVPLAVAFGAEAAWLLLYLRGPRLLTDATALALGLLLVLARLGWCWPTSGHGILGALLAVLAPWPWLRAFGLAILPQAVLTKWIAAEDPEDVPLGALVGLALGIAATFTARRLCTRVPGGADVEPG